MLSRDVPSTPRPRPPAKVRRAPSLNFPPPPPYAPRTDMLLNSPITVTSQLVSAAGSPSGDIKDSSMSAAAEEWMNERSKEELSDLLIKADSVIKSRESELGLTSALCKTLYKDNVALKTKHDALIARIPTASGHELSPIASPLPSPSPLNKSPHYYAADLPANSPLPSPRSITPPRLRHSRRISVTPAELAQLADQNAELLDKLEKLEEESEHADQAGKRKLRKLEKEIQGLKEELEKTQAQSEELAERAKAVLSLNEETLSQKRKEEREQRVKRLRASVSSEALNAEVKDFAPAPELPRSISLNTISESSSEPSSPAPPLNLSTKPQLLSMIPAEDQPSYFPPLTSTPSTIAPRPEYALISQLLLKIRELEETNAQIASEQTVTAERLRTAQKEAGSIRKAYDCLATEGGDLRILSEDYTSPPVTSQAVNNAGTIRFSSLRRSFDGDDVEHFSDYEGDDFVNGIIGVMQSTTRSSVAPGSNTAAAGTHQHKARRSVVGLFDEEPTNIHHPHAHAPNDRGPNVPAEYPSTLSVSPAFRHVSPLPTDLGDISVWSTAATEGFNPSSPSPAISTLEELSSNAPNLRPNFFLAERGGSGSGFGSGSSLGQFNGKRHTLGSELGSEFGDDWGENAGNHHLRTSSLLDLAGMVSLGGGGSSRGASPVPSLGASPIDPIPFDLTSTPERSPSELDWEDVVEVNRVPVSVAGSTTPHRGKGLQLSIDPPTPTKSPRFIDASPTPYKDPRGTRNYRLSQTVRARTHRWVEGRYTSESPISPGTGPLVRRRRPMNRPNKGSDASIIFSETFDTVVRQLSFSGAQYPGEINIDEVSEQEDGEDIGGGRGEEDQSTLKQVVTSRNVSSNNVFPPPKQDGFVGFILEVWLWLQFAIVVLVFLWAMARRGPKSVLQEAESRRRSVQGVPSRR
ncbi:hypothetical protein ABKN59_000602 [Abortiporus biennis]